MNLARVLAAVLVPAMIVPPQILLAQPRGAAKAEAPKSDVQLDGYSKAASDKERGWETKFRALPATDNLRENMRRLSARPHHVGSPYDKDNAEWMLAKFKEWGWTRRSRTSMCCSPRRKSASSS